MTHTVQSERNQERTRQEPQARPSASEHGHTGEGAASALAYLISQGEKRKQDDAAPEARTDQ